MHLHIYKSLLSPTVGMNWWQLINSSLFSFPCIEQFENSLLLQLLSNRMLRVTDTRRYCFSVCLSTDFTDHLTETKPHEFIRPVYYLPTMCRSFRYHFSCQNFTFLLSQIQWVAFSVSAWTRFRVTITYLCLILKNPWRLRKNTCPLRPTVRYTLKALWIEYPDSVSNNCINSWTLSVAFIKIANAYLS